MTEGNDNFLLGNGRIVDGLGNAPFDGSVLVEAGRISRVYSAESPIDLPETVRRRFIDKYGRRITQEGDLLITSQRFRDAGRNVADCLEKLRVMLAEAAAVPKRRKTTKPTRGSIERRLAAG